MKVSEQAYGSCPVGHSLSVINGKWKLAIINALLNGPQRFNGLKRSLTGISQRLLTAQLRALESDGVVQREVKNFMPPHVEYSLTEEGQGLAPVIAELSAWGEKRLAKPNVTN